MIDLRSETMLTIPEVASRQRVEIRTVRAWMSRADDRRLESFRCGRFRRTTVEAVERFIGKWSEGDFQVVVAPKERRREPTARQKKKAYQSALVDLRRHGIVIG